MQASAQSSGLATVQDRTGENLQLAWQSFGHEQSPPLLLCSGLGSQLLQWPETLCHQVASAGFRVIRFDPRDAGQSSRLAHLGVPDLDSFARAWRQGDPLPPPYSLEAMADDAAELLRCLGLPRAHVCGASVGGMVAQALALRHPQRVLSLTCIMSAGSSLGLPVSTKVALSTFSAQEPADEAAYLAHQLRLRRVLASSGEEFDEPVETQLLRAQWRRGVSAAGTARQLAAFFAWGDRRPALAAVRAPSLVLHGAEDLLLPLRAGEQLAAALPGSTLAVYQGMGHDLPRHLCTAIGHALLAHLRRVAH